MAGPPSHATMQLGWHGVPATAVAALLIAAGTMARPRAAVPIRAWLASTLTSSRRRLRACVTCHAGTQRPPPPRPRTTACLHERDGTCNVPCLFSVVSGPSVLGMLRALRVLCGMWCVVCGVWEEKIAKWRAARAVPHPLQAAQAIPNPSPLGTGGGLAGHRPKHGFKFLLLGVQHALTRGWERTQEPKQIRGPVHRIANCEEQSQSIAGFFNPTLITSTSAAIFWSETAPCAGKPKALLASRLRESTPRARALPAPAAKGGHKTVSTSDMHGPETARRRASTSASSRTT